MIFSSDDISTRVAVFFLAFCGLMVARHIYKHKKPDQKPLTCLAGFDCHTVVHSDYSKFMGVDLTILGMVYYVLMSLSYLLLIFAPETLPPIFIYLIILGSLAAFLFSIYLIGIQIFILKKGCSWCFVSAFISTLIFILNLFAYDFVHLAQTFLR
jgi:uncharacterized membrane protein